MNKAVIDLLKEKYFLPTENSWEELVERVQQLHPPIKEYMLDMRYIPSTPTLLNAYTNGYKIGTLSSCFTMKITDSIVGIYDALKEAALVTKASGGVGYNFSNLRGSLEIVKGIGRNSSGPMPFIDNFNSMLDGIQQGGVRRGAGMAQLDITHPNILDFIRAKKNLYKFTRLNFSVRMTEKFYKDLKNNPDKTHRVKNVGDNKWHDLQDENGVVTIKKLWQEIIHQAWRTGEPGIFNNDIAFNRCTVTNLDSEVLSNPCAEFVNIPNTSCCLGSINVAKFVTISEDDGALLFDIIEFKAAIREAVYTLNAVIDNNTYPVPAIEEVTLKTRPIGLGIMGLAHLFYKMKVPYNSKEAKDFTADIMRVMTLYGMRVSVDIAKKKGKGYPAFNYDLFMKANKRFFKGQEKTIDAGIDIGELINDIEKYEIWNSSITSIAPTGSISFIAETNGGIEPVFALSMVRKLEQKDGTYKEVQINDKVFQDYVEEIPDEKTKEAIYDWVINNKGSVQGCSLIPEQDQKIFVVAGDLKPMEHLEILEATAQNISLSASKTINLSRCATEQDVEDVFLSAHERGIIGVTVYRDGCREGVLVHTKKDIDEDEKHEIQIIKRRRAPKRPEELPCDIYETRVKGERYIVLIGKLHGTIYELFATKDKKDKIDLDKNKIGFITKIKKKRYDLFDANRDVLIEDIGSAFNGGEYATLARFVSGNLRHGAELQWVVEQLTKEENFLGFDTAVSRVLKKYIKEGEKVMFSKECPNCGAEMVYREGCKMCLACGNAACS